MLKISPVISELNIQANILRTTLGNIPLNIVLSLKEPIATIHKVIAIDKITTKINCVVIVIGLMLRKLNQFLL